MKSATIASAIAIALLSTCTARAAEAPKDPATISASDQLTALREETKVLRERVKQARAAAQLSKALKARDKARADLVKIAGGVL